jgi:hypothetical protein
VRPPTGTPLEHPLPEAEAPFGPTVPTAGSCSAFVVSHHHDGLLRSKVTGLLHPATGQGFDAFPASRLQRSPKAALQTVGIPRDAVHTLRRVPLASSRTASLRPLPSCRYIPLPDVSSGRSLPNHRHPRPEPKIISRTWPELRREQAPDPGERCRPVSEETGQPCPPFGIGQPFLANRMLRFGEIRRPFPEGNCQPISVKPCNRFDGPCRPTSVTLADRFPKETANRPR